MIKKIIFVFVIIITLSHYHISILFAQPPKLGTPQWVTAFANPYGATGVSQMKVDRFGNTFIAGGTGNKMLYKSRGQHNNRTQLSGTQQNNALISRGYLAKYDCTGQLLWLNELGDSISSAGIGDICLDSAGNVYAYAVADYGLQNTYWGDSIINGIMNPTPLTGQSATMIFKADGQTGRMLWHWTAQQQWGNNTNIEIQGGNASNYYLSGQTFSTMVTINDSLYVLLFVDTAIGNTQQAICVYGFDKNNGQLHQQSKLCLFPSSGSASTPYCKFYGLGADINKNLMAVGFINNAQPNKILDSSITLPTATTGGSMIIVTFKRNHFISAIIAPDGIGANTCNFDYPENGFEIIVGAVGGQHVFDNFYITTKGSLAGGAFSPLLHFGADKKFKWGLQADTAVNTLGFVATTQDALGNIYGQFQYGDALSIQGFHINRPNSGGFQAFRIHLNDSLITGVFPDVSRGGLISANVINLGVPEKGTLIAGGYYAQYISDTLFAGKDSTTFSNQGYDAFAIAYGYPCSNDSALIEPVATDNLKANCTNTDSIQLTWNDNSNIEWGYHIYRATGGSTATYNLIATTLPNTTSYYDKTISAGNNYWYKVAAFNNIGDGGITNVDSSMSCKTVGINDLKLANQKLKIYPNPVSSTMNILLLEGNLRTIEITDVVGKIMQTVFINQPATTIQVGDLLNGVYLIKITDDKGFQHTEKFIKE